MQQFKHLFSPLEFGKVRVKNRIMSTAHTTAWGELDGLPGAGQTAYYLTKAKGGVGLVITQIYAAHPSGALPAMAPVAWTIPNAADKFRKFTDVIHDYGVVVGAQLWHGGAQIAGGIANPWAPSVLPAPTLRYTPHEMTTEEIKEVVRGFGEGAKVLREGGYDLVEIHGAHGYLICQFMSPWSNRRADDYGGSLENRMRFPLEIIDSIREAVGTDFTVGMRISGDELHDGGYTLDDMLVMAPLLTQGGKLDYLSVSVGTYWSEEVIIAPMYFPLGFAVYLSSAIKEVVDIPVFCIGRINDPVQAEQILENNQADMVGMTRALICDPELPSKAREGKLDDIRKCLGCSEACWGFTGRLLAADRGRLGCAINPAVGMETQPGWLELAPATTKKRVMVIGGGPAGLEAARVAASRGHSVSLYEKESELGGLIQRVASKAPGRDGFVDMERYYSHQLEVLGVEINLGVEVTVDMVKEKNPDAVVVAIGSLPRIPLDVSGTDEDIVVEARDVLAGNVEVGQNVLVLAGEHHIQALSTADFLAELGKKVEVLCEEFYAGSQIPELATKHAIYARLFQKGVTLTPCTWVKRISGKTVVTYNVFAAQERSIEVDTVVLACGGIENNSLYRALKDQVKELHAAGDCVGVKRFPEAVRDGAIVGRAL